MHAVTNKRSTHSSEGAFLEKMVPVTVPCRASNDAALAGAAAAEAESTGTAAVAVAATAPVAAPARAGMLTLVSSRRMVKRASPTAHAHNTGIHHGSSGLRDSTLAVGGVHQVVILHFRPIHFQRAQGHLHCSLIEATEVRCGQMPTNNAPAGLTRAKRTAREAEHVGGRVDAVEVN